MYRSVYCDVDYVPQRNIVHVVWKQFCKGEDYRAPLRHALAIMREHRGCQYAADTRQGFENDPADTQWLFDEFLPAAAQTDCKYIYFIIDRSNSLREELEGQSSELEKLFAVRYCFDVSEVSHDGA